MEIVEKRDDFTARLIMKGQWLYDNLKLMPVQIFAINHDYWFELDGGYNNGDEKPELNSLGEQYLVAWHSNKFFSKAVTFSNGYLTLNEAITEAENIVKQKIIWEEKVTNNYI